MKVFEVIRESYKNKNDIDRIIEYVTVDNDDITLVAASFANHCEQYDEHLISIREVLTIVQHIKREK